MCSIHTIPTKILCYTFVMKTLLLSLFFWFCSVLTGQTITSSFSTVSFLPGGTTTLTLTYTDSVPPSNITGMQFYLPSIPGFTYSNVIPGPSAGNLTCVYYNCLSVSFNSAVAILLNGLRFTFSLIRSMCSKNI